MYKENGCDRNERVIKKKGWRGEIAIIIIIIIITTTTTKTT